MDAIRNNKPEINVVLLAKRPVMINFYKLLTCIQISDHIIADSGNGIPFVDTNHIRNLTTASFTKENKAFSKETNRFGFGTPITIVVNKMMQIIMEHAPQDLDGLIRYCRYL